MRIKITFIVFVLITVLDSILADRVTAQTFTTLHSFTAGSDGALPYSGLILLSNTLYGTASQSGDSGYGTVFAVNANGTRFSTVHTFSGIDGANPFGGLILSSNTFYGTTQAGGEGGGGTVFALKTNGTGFTNLHSFTYSSDGVRPNVLVLSSNSLYGTTEGRTTLGGPAEYGSVFAMKADGTGFTNLHLFTSGSDGAYPTGLILSGNVLYGTTAGDDISIQGTVFAININGTGFTNLHTFTAAPAPYNTNTDGHAPGADLTESNGILYGTAATGGSSGSGILFRLNIDGTGFTNLYNFTARADFSPYNNPDGANPLTRLILSGNTLYGTAYSGGDFGSGTVYAVNTDGTGFTTLHSFTAHSGLSSTNSDGEYPRGNLILSGSTLYGTANLGGTSGPWGTVFSLSLQMTPQLTIIRSGANVILSWPTNSTGFTLQSTTNLFSAVWTTNSPAPIVVNGQNTVTNSISGIQRFYRLSN